MARRYASLHHNIQDGQNIIFHREHRSKKGRSAIKPGKLQKFKQSDRRKWNTLSRSQEFLSKMDGKQNY